MSKLELKVLPLVVAALAAGIIAGIDWLLPQARYAVPFGDIAALILALAGGAVGVLGILAFKSARTTVNPTRPGDASSLVTGGIYRITRNPMYLGVLLLLLGWSLYLGNAVAWLGAVGFVLYLDRFQIGPEERMMAQLFGEDFRAYRSRVRRWI